MAPRNSWEISQCSGSEPGAVRGWGGTGQGLEECGRSTQPVRNPDCQQCRAPGFLAQVLSVRQSPRSPSASLSRWVFYLQPWASLVARMVKNLPLVQGTQIQFLNWEDALEKGMATHSSILAWRISWTGAWRHLWGPIVGHD